MNEVSFQPAAAGQSAANAPAWQQALDRVFTLGTDYLRFKLIDAERVGDDANIPDQADLYYGFERPVGSLTLGSSLLLAAVVFGGGYLLFRALK